MLTTTNSKPGRLAGIATALLASLALSAATARAADQVYFSSVTNVTDLLVQRINAETVRVDMSCWYLTEHSISIALLNKFQSGVPVRLIGDRGSIFEIDPKTKAEFYWLASQGVPIRLRFNPTWYPEIDHWKTTIFAGQNLVTFGSGNYTPFELAPWSATNYKDEVFLFTDDPSIVGAVRTKFDRYWNDTLAEPESLVATAPYFKNWNDACAAEPTGNCSDYATLYPNPAPMIINTARLEPDNPLPADLIWGQGPDFNNRLVQEINNETKEVDLISYRLTVDNITSALLAKFQAGVPVRIIMEPNEYLNRKWPEFWLTHANIDTLWAAGVPIMQRTHDGLTHMKVLITSNYTTVASSNFAAAWQRDIDYFISATAKPAVYTTMKNQFNTMWTNTAAFAPFAPQPPDAPTLATPAAGATGVATNASLVWNAAAFAVSYAVYFGTNSANLPLVATVPAQLVNNPPSTYSWTPSAPFQPGTTYYWKIVSRTNATPVNPNMVAPSSIQSFTTAGTSTPPPTPANPNPADGTTGVGLSPTLSWSVAPIGTTYAVAFGTSNPPPTVATGLSAASYAPGQLSANTKYYWSASASNSNGTAAGPVWSFTTGTQAVDVVVYASDIPASAIHGMWSVTSDATSPNGVKLATPLNGWFTKDAPLASPADYVDVTFNANAGVPYTFWMRLQSVNNSKSSDSVWVQFADAYVNGSQVYPINSTSGLLTKLASDSTALSDNAWGWVNSAYWLTQATTVTFPTTGPHTLRVQVRFAGVQFDQIVLSPTTYYSPSASCPNTCGNAPGPFTNDHTIVPKPTSSGPGVPSSPSPANGATGVGASPTLTWSASGATSYDVSFGTTNPPPQVTSGQTAATYSPGALAASTTYLWQITAHNNAGSTTGPVWSFSTTVAPPGVPSSPNPANTATGVSTSTTLTWTAAGATTYDVLFGTTQPPSQVASGLTTPSYTPAGLAPSTTYYWQIVARNSAGTNQGPQWSFTTAAAAQPPAAPGSPSPANGATAVAVTPTLTWTAAGATSYDVAFGTTNPPPAVTTGQTSASYTPATLAYSTTYYWRIVAHNANGATTGTVWSFTTTAPPPPPGTPGTPSPASAATGVATNTSLTWSATNAASYDVSFGTTNPPPSAATGLTTASYTPAGMVAGTTYYWQVVARNANGATSGPVWSFTTAPAPTNIVIYAGDIPAANIHGAWNATADSTAAGGTKLATSTGTNQTANALAAPADYVDVTFNAVANTPYTLWLRIQALNNSKYSDSAWVQFSDAQINGAPAYSMNATTALLVNLATDSTAASDLAWGWVNGAYWLTQTTTVTFPTSGTHTLRIQPREYGVQFDQIVLSPTTYYNPSASCPNACAGAPGPVSNDHTIVPKP